MKRDLDLPTEVWAAFDRAAEVRGSHEAVLRWWLSAGGVFESGDIDLEKLRESQEMARKLKEQGYERPGYTLPAPHERRRATTLDAIGIDRDSKRGKASLEVIRRPTKPPRGKR